MRTGWLLALAAPLSSVATSVVSCFVPGLGLARAAEPPGCPPGEWFCDDGSADREPGASPEPLPPGDGWDDSPPPGSDERDRGNWSDDRRIDVRHPNREVIGRGWSEGSGGRAASPWGLTMHVQGILLSGGRRDRASLGGIGVSGRYALNPVVTLDLGVDSIVGTDYDGYDRSELALALSSLFFLNEHPLLRAYVLVGLNTSRARIDLPGDDQIWGYFGGHTGLGMEVSLDPRVALSLDVLGFMRGRTDSRAEREPEFTDSQGRVTNTSGGGLVRGGIILHF